MHPCRFPLGPPKLQNNSLDGKHLGFSFFFDNENVTYKSYPDVDKSKYRVTLIHKETGEITQFYEKWLALKPEIKEPKLEDDINNTNVDNGLISSTPLKRKSKVNEQISTKVQKLDEVAIKRFTEMKVEDMLNEDKKLPLKFIAPDLVLQSLSKLAHSLSSKTSAQLDEMVEQKILNPSVLSVVKRQPAGDYKKIELCLLLNLMINMYLMKASSLRRKVVFDDYPELVSNFLVDCYTDNLSLDATLKKKRCMSTENRRKLFTMILVITCYLTNYNFQCNELLSDVGSSIDRTKKSLAMFDVVISTPTNFVGESMDYRYRILTAKSPFVDDS